MPRARKNTAEQEPDNLAELLPPGDGPDPVAEAHERQAEAVDNTAPPIGDGSGEQRLGSGGNDRYGQAKADLDRLEEIKELQKALRKEAAERIDRLEKEHGVNRGALAEVRRMMDLSPAAIVAREESRKEIFEWLIAPKLEEAADAGSEG